MGSQGHIGPLQYLRSFPRGTLRPAPLCVSGRVHCGNRIHVPGVWNLTQRFRRSRIFDAQLSSVRGVTPLSADQQPAREELNDSLPRFNPVAEAPNPGPNPGAHHALRSRHAVIPAAAAD